MHTAPATSQSSLSTSTKRLQRARKVKLQAQGSLLADGDNIVVARPKQYSTNKIEHPENSMTGTKTLTNSERTEPSPPSSTTRSPWRKSPALRSAQDDYGDFLLYYVGNRKDKNAQSPISVQPRPSLRSQLVSNCTLGKRRKSRSKKRIRRGGAGDGYTTAYSHGTDVHARGALGDI
jgi:hypothetical protein